jgi:hypothetical protein
MLMRAAQIEMHVRSGGNKSHLCSDIVRVAARNLLSDTFCDFSQFIH